MEFRANEGRSVTIEVSRKTCARHTIQIHFAQVGESYIDLVEQYVKPLWQLDDLLSPSEKIISLCQKRVAYKKDMEMGRLARLLSHFASRSSAGIGVDSPHKMQFATNEQGALFVFWAVFCAGVAELLGKRGVFYEVVGQEASDLDGLYDHEFQEYGELGIRTSENLGKVCNEVETVTGVQAMIVDVNDLNVEILGKVSSVILDDETLKGLIRDNPAGQSQELTPLTLIREVREERALEEAQAQIRPQTAQEAEFVLAQRRA